MRVLIFDPFAGISGDMFLGAVLALGYPVERLREVAARLGAPPGSVSTDTVQRRSIACRSARFELPREHHHRHLPDILEILEGGLDGEALALARRIFERLAAAEASVHGIDPDHVHFHEVGALDSILDIGCAADAVRFLNIEECFTRAVSIGRGWIDIDHGRFPLPAPATAKLLEGMDIGETQWDGECTTPTGAAILAELTDGRPPPTRWRVLASGYGAGSRDPADRPNCLRLLLAELSSEQDTTMVIVQSDLDDMAPEYVPPALEALRAAGAVDVTTSAVGMKKGRPGLRIEALAPYQTLDSVLDALFESTTTIGARYWTVGRRALPRTASTRLWHGTRIRSKQVHLPDGQVRRKPEFDDVASAARDAGVPPLGVRQALDSTEPTDEDGTAVGGSTPVEMV
ncbi:MAG: nickel pincer cofactor biosynthesis protein LarC [Gemmatimonadota bacterium]